MLRYRRNIVFTFVRRHMISLGYSAMLSLMSVVRAVQEEHIQKAIDTDIRIEIEREQIKYQAVLTEYQTRLRRIYQLTDGSSPRLILQEW